MKAMIQWRCRDTQRATEEKLWANHTVKASEEEANDTVRQWNAWDKVFEYRVVPHNSQIPEPAKPKPIEFCFPNKQANKANYANRQKDNNQKAAKAD